MKCSELESTVGRLHAQIEDSARTKQDMEARIGRLSTTLSESGSGGRGAREEAGRTQRALASAEAEKKASECLQVSNSALGRARNELTTPLFSQVLQERLSDSRLQVSALRQGEDDLHAKLSQLQNDLQRSESKSNQLELQLESSRKFLADAKGDSSAADNYLREELSRMKAEAEQSKERARESRKTVSE